MSVESIIIQIESIRSFDLLFKLKHYLFWFGFNTDSLKRILSCKIWSIFDRKVKEHSGLIYAISGASASSTGGTNAVGGASASSPTLAWIFFPECYDIYRYPIDIPAYRVDITLMLAYSYKWGNVLAGPLFLTRLQAYLEKGDALGNKYALTPSELIMLRTMYLELYCYKQVQANPSVKVLMFTELRKSLCLFDTDNRQIIEQEIKDVNRKIDHLDSKQLLENSYQYDKTGLACYLYYKLDKHTLTAKELLNYAVKCKCALALIEQYRYRTGNSLSEIAKRGEPYAWQIYGDIFFEAGRHEEAYEMYRTAGLNGYITAFQYGAEKLKRKKPALSKKLLLELYERGDKNVMQTLFYTYPCDEYQEKLKQVVDQKLRMEYGSTLNEERNKAIEQEINKRFQNRVKTILSIIS